MTNLVISEIRVIEHGQQITAPSDEVFVEGDLARQDTTDGQLTGTLGTTATEANWAGLVINIDAGQVVTVAGNGSLVTLGSALDAVAYGANIFVSDTANTIADSTGTAGVKVGIVEAVRNQGTVYKALRLIKELN